MITDSVHAKALRLATSSLNFGLFRMCSALARFAAEGALPCELTLTLHFVIAAPRNGIGDSCFQLPVLLPDSAILSVQALDGTYAYASYARSLPEATILINIRIPWRQHQRKAPDLFDSLF
ncbi:hypothetical protein [Paramagnetospirillum magnetotacticum]|uniref:hypothetical protein n=1 Tax=Paramagnetospirillum magnetotacticum TaxID=188 RepID=UPI001F4707B8|nr:hypothetical protein [Paramagnetospirillum magnetotacticum]